MLLLINVLLTSWFYTAHGQGKPCDYPVIKHGRLYYSYRGYFPARVNQQFVYYCDQYFVPPSQSSWDYLTCTAEGWSPEEPCLRQCTFNYLENGHNPRREEKYLQGKTVRVHCYDGYSLENNQNTMTCTENGWSPPPRCIRVKTCSKNSVRIENGFLSESAFTYPLNKQTEYKCKPGYVTADGKTSGLITCLQNGWSAQPVCIKSCDRPVFEKARPKSDGTWFSLNHRLDYECLDGYENRDGHTAGSIVCGQDGWSDKAACYEIICDPPRIPNGVYRPELSKYRGQDTITYECKKGFIPEIHGNVATCTRDGWVPAPRCTLKPCNYPVIKHGRLHYPYRGYFPARVNQQFSYYCDWHFVPPSQSSWDYLTCTAEGWSPKEPCLRQCIFNYLENGRTPPREEKYLQGKTVRVDCYDGYSLENNQNTMTCTENGWSPPPRCIRVNPQGKCGPPPPIDNGDITSLLQSVYPSGTVVEYRCQAYYELRGNRNVICQSGEWSEPPKCLEACVISEETMRKHHIQLKWKDDTKLYSKTEDNIEFTCQRGYRPVTAEHTFRTTCREGKVVYPSCG